eukprot:CAMPEP_0115039554 /NCGR_PEP_ID=MMETSP0216-20121206/44128_1 /TAXON_ID=223996 /ORGANISM="Protocruzia adherens, Strain Boccale" /LENGTH=36 /DNA_ID= /DNA_START= /DNA_END= /DNA_ORIENTATION=
MMFTLAFELEREGKAQERMETFGLSIAQDFVINQSL